MKPLIPDGNTVAIDGQALVESGNSAALRDARPLSVTTPHGIALDIDLLAFDIEAFTTEAFAASGITCPPSVLRSVRKRQAEFYFGRVAARNALGALGIQAFDVDIGASRQPLWPMGVTGSISHTHAYAAAVALRLGECSGVGIDLEHMAGPDASAALSATVVDAEELRYLGTLTEVCPANMLLTLAFSAKESLFKAAFGAVGRYFDFSAARVFLMNREQGIIRLQLTETLCDSFVSGQVCEVGFSFIKSDLVMTYFSW